MKEEERLAEVRRLRRVGCVGVGRLRCDDARRLDGGGEAMRRM